MDKKSTIFRTFSLLLLLLLAAAELWAAPKIESWQTGNGAKVLFVPSPGLPMVDIRVVFDAGSARDTVKPGLAVLTNAMLGESTGDWSADQVAERLEFVGAELGNGALRDMAWVSVRSLTEQKVLDTTLETLSAVLAKPAFVNKDMERIRESMLAALQQEAESPGEIAEKAFYSALYKGHPYASNPNGTPESIKSIAEAEVRAFHKTFYVGRNAVVAIVGDLTIEQAKAVAERSVGTLPSGRHAPVLSKPQSLSEAVIRHIDHPSSQTHIHIGQPGVERGDPDYYPLYVGNHILGGSGLVSILSGEVREKRGLSYSVYSYFMPMRKPGPFQMGAQTRNSQAEEARTVMMETLRRYIEQGPTERELEAAKNNISGGFPMKVSSNKKIVEYLAMIGFYGLPLDYLDKLVPNVLAVTREEIRNAFRRRLNPDRFVTVTVGKGN